MMATQVELLSEQLEGREVYTSDGEKVGKVETVYLDRATNQCEWVAVKSGFMGLKRLLLPMAGARPEGDAVRLAYTRQQIDEAPEVDETSLGSDDDERVIFDHYGLAYPGRSFDRTEATEQPSDGGSVVRHEEELAVGTREVDAGTARLRKWVETEDVSEDVPLQHETAHVTREAINRPADAGSIGAEQVEVQLTGEEAVVQKQTIAKERVSLDKDVETDTERVTEQVRSEQVEIDRSGDARRS